MAKAGDAPDVDPEADARGRVKGAQESASARATGRDPGSPLAPEAFSSGCLTFARAPHAPAPTPAKRAARDFRLNHEVEQRIHRNDFENFSDL